MKPIIVLVISFILLNSIGNAQPEVIEHCVTQSSLIDSGTLSVIDAPLFENSANKLVIIQKIRLEDNDQEVNNPGNLTLTYIEDIDRWAIQDEGGDQLVVNACYNVIISESNEDYAFNWECNSSSIDSQFPNTCVIDEPLINDDPDARCFWGYVRDIDNIANDLDYNLYYNYANPGSWVLWSLLTATIPVGVRFNFLCNPIGITHFEHLSDFENIDRLIVSAQIFSLWTVLSNPLINNNPNAKIFVSHRREPDTEYFLDSNSVKYNTETGFWQIHWELETLTSGDTVFPTNRFWDIFVLDSSLSNDDSEFSVLKLYPNPSNSIFKIESKEPILEMKLFNTLGQELNSFEVNRSLDYKIDMSNFSNGSYFVRVIAENASETIRLVKN
ncbi:MAG: T9SS type A sorting domain-containing protein [Bacteroidota bacterium]